MTRSKKRSRACGHAGRRANTNSRGGAGEDDCEIREDIDVQISRQIFFTDSTTVYHWIHNQEAKHPVYVANRLNCIHLSQPDAPPQQWRWVPTSENPADVVSRGAMPGDHDAWKLFHGGPEFISRPEAEWPTLPIGDVATVGVSDVDEVTQESSVAPSFIETLLRKKSDAGSVLE